MILKGLDVPPMKPASVLFLFFLYSFAGWIWESCYVSLHTRRWTNRGFLRGPFLPIYGFGALLITALFTPFATHPLLLFLAGMASATVLEYGTGISLERMFHQRYWDYSRFPFQLHGYISLYSSLWWGFSSLVLVRFLHPLATSWVRTLPAGTVILFTSLLLVLESIDLLHSLHRTLPAHPSAADTPADPFLSTCFRPLPF